MFQLNTIGVIMLIHGTTPPDGWLFCDGREIKINNDYVKLFSILSNRFGGDGRSSFKLPNLSEVGGCRYAICAAGELPITD